MERHLGRHSEVAWTLLRVMAGLMFAIHGAMKFGLLGGNSVWAMGPKMQAAAVIELGCGVLIALGLFGGFAAFLASGQMAFAYFMGHAPQGLWNPIANKGELAVLYCFLWLYTATRGSGPYSLDAMLFRKR